jgi:acyl-CoA thioester hydrolase
MFEHRFVAGWGDMDFNAHMRNTAYLDRGADTRMLFFAGQGFPMAEFRRLALGPVVMRDEIDYRAEIALLEGFTARLALAGLADDGSRFVMHNEFVRDDGKLAARVRSTVGWLDLRERRLSAPPPALLAALRALAPTDDFATLPSSLRGER